MAKRQARNARPTRTSDADLRNKGFDPFLRPEHVTEGEQLELTGFNAIDRGQAREQFKCQVTNQAGDTFTLGVREGSPDHRIMHTALGANYRDWRGSVTVTIQPGTRGGSFVNVKAASEALPKWSDEEPPHPAEQE